MFLAKDQAAFDTDRKRLAAWADIRHLQWGFAQRREYRKPRQHGRNPAEEVVDVFYSEVKRPGGIDLGSPELPNDFEVDGGKPFSVTK